MQIYICALYVLYYNTLCTAVDPGDHYMYEESTESQQNGKTDYGGLIRTVALQLYTHSLVDYKWHGFCMLFQYPGFLMMQKCNILNK